MELETVNKLYLELSQIATAKTGREIALERDSERLKEVSRERLNLLRDITKAVIEDGDASVSDELRTRLVTATLAPGI